MLNSHPKWMSGGRFSFRMSIEHWELNIGQILPSPRSHRRDEHIDAPTVVVFSFSFQAEENR
ncbi:MAG: hypothetical protein DMG12_27900 [Acidobacteria bacterium]|nr:MAG: hypothetical protein DMG12_27900 [Acidobacteriota bacterium]